MTVNKATMIEKLEVLLGKKALFNRREFHAADMQATWAAIGKAQKLLGWSPTVDLDEGLKRTVQWHNENRTLVQSLRP